MGEIDRIRDQMKRAYEKEAWFGPAVNRVLEGVTAEQASKRPIAGAHTIWELVLHMAVWKMFVRRSLAGEDVTISDEVDWQKVTDTSPEAWQAAKDALDAEHARLMASLDDLTEERLDQPATRKGLTAYFILHGVVQHDVYHAGQIAILKK